MANYYNVDEFLTVEEVDLKILTSRILKISFFPSLNSLQYVPVVFHEAANGAVPEQTP